jgi:hypothetical protein
MNLHYVLHNQTPRKMKKIITIIAITLLTSGTIFADNNNTVSTSSNNNKETVATVNNNSNVITVTINDMNGKVVYTETFTSNDENSVDFKLNVTNKLAKGIYVVTVVFDGEKMTQKLVVE